MNGTFYFKYINMWFIIILVFFYFFVDDTILSKSNHSLTFLMNLKKLYLKLIFGRLWNIIYWENKINKSSKFLMELDFTSKHLNFYNSIKPFNIESDRFLILTCYPNFFVKGLYQDFCLQTSLDTESKVPDSDAENCFRLLFP